MNILKIKQEMHKYTEIVWKEVKEVKFIQEKLNSPSEENNDTDLDHIIIRNWKTGLEDNNNT